MLVTVAPGCTTATDRDATSSPEAPSLEHGSEGVPRSRAWRARDVRVDRIPNVLGRQVSRLPASFPADDSALPNLLTSPPGRALLTYHPRESFDDQGRWASEHVFFYGVDAVWRSLRMSDLGLPDSTHPGADTYGAGELSPDGTFWVAKAEDGIVLLDLSSGRSRVVRVPGDHTSYIAWHPDGETIEVTRLHGASTQRTWSIDRHTGDVERRPYLMPVDGFAGDGSVVTFVRRRRDTVRIVRRGNSQSSDVVAVPYRLARRGGVSGSGHTLLGLNRELVALRSDSLAPVARLRLGPGDATGWPRGWWNPNTLWCYEARRGLITWNVADGRVRLLTRVRPGARTDTYWSASVAVDLMR